jgi:hypothetical protein
MLRHFPALVLLPCLATSLNAQIASSEAATCNPKFAQSLVEQQVAEGRSVSESLKRIKILLRSADFLWTLDEPTARAYFAEAYKVATDHFAEKGFERSEAGEKGRTIQVIEPDVRTDVIKAIARRDGEWARKLSDQLLAEYDKAAADRSQADKRREPDELLRIAAENVSTNPQFARHLFNLVMKYPLESTWFSILYLVWGKDPAIADALYRDLLRNYANEPVSRLTNLSGYPFGSERRMGFNKYQLSVSPPAGFSPNAALQRSFIDLILRRIAAHAADPEELSRPVEKYGQPEGVHMMAVLNDIEPIVISQFADLLQRFSVARSQANGLLTEDMRKALGQKSDNAIFAQRSFEERLKALEEADGKGTLNDRDIAYMVTTRPKTDEQFAALESWMPKIKDERLRKDTMSYYWFLRSQLATTEGRLTDAEKFASKVPELEHRSILLFEIAKKQLENANSTAAAFDTLNAVSKLTRSAPNSVSKSQILMGLASFYEKVNHSVALDELSESVKVINTLENPDVFSGFVMRQLSGKDWSFYASFPTAGNNFEKTFTDMGKNDFELTLSNAKLLSDKYLRTIAVLAVAKNCVPAKPVAPVKNAARPN